MKSFPAAVQRSKAEPIEFELAGDVFHFTPPKVAAMTLAVLDSTGDPADQGITAFRAFMDWLGDGLPPAETDKLISRLKDPEDDLDLPDLEQVVTWLMGEIAGRPTRPSSGSSG